MKYDRMNEFMKKKGVWTAALIVIIVLLVVYSRMQRKEATKLSPVSDSDTTQVDTRVQGDSGLTLDVRNGTYTIDGTPIAVVDGVATSQIADSATMRKTTILEGPAFGDINGDGLKDGVVLLRDETGGSGVFYYVAGVLGQTNSQKTTNAILLGDRIRIKEISLDGNTISVTILERAEGEAMTTVPTVTKVVTFTVRGDALVKNQ